MEVVIMRMLTQNDRCRMRENFRGSDRCLYVPTQLWSSWWHDNIWLAQTKDKQGSLTATPLTKEKEEDIRLQILRCNRMINQVTSNAADDEACLVPLADIGNWREYDACKRYIKNMEELATYVCCTCFHWPSLTLIQIFMQSRKKRGMPRLPHAVLVLTLNLQIGYRGNFQLESPALTLR